MEASRDSSRPSQETGAATKSAVEGIGTNVTSEHTGDVSGRELSGEEEQEFQRLFDLRGWTLADILEGTTHLAEFAQEKILAQIARSSPVLATRLLFPDEDDASTRVLASVEYKRLQERELAREAFEKRRGAREPLYPQHLGDIADLLADGSVRPPEPTVGGLLYPGRINAIYGTHTAGKTWLALLLAKLNMAAGGVTLLVDYEDSAIGIAQRCMLMDRDLANSLVYIHANSGLLSVEELGQTIEDNHVTLVILDSVGESMAAAGKDSNADRDVTQWFAEVPDAIAARGPAVLLLDHVAKRQDGTASPVGSFRKSAAINGAQFVLENKVGFSRDRSGWSKLTCTKDRNGFFATGEVVGRVDFTPPMEGGIDVRFVRGEAEAVAKPDGIEDRVLKFIESRWMLHEEEDEDGQPIEGRPDITQIRSAVTGDNTKIREAVDRLVARGYLEQVVVSGGRKRSRNLYRPARDPFGTKQIDANE